ncbi:protein translocase subunit SecF [Marinicauda salina]|uniref:Protein-export membrane protein SecF n=1 Tax=Marinicauda salina TaxID=2135793 RepID=A0A2U2BRK6_9PROT|nr:protein translocase subunit SecF [Marinicauda salina]PWE16644.1 protein translocase subunit SecF [Marinicauda salina]
MKLALVRFIPTDTNIPFIRLRFAALVASTLLIIGSAAAFFGLGLNFGIDFRGGTLIEIQTEGPADLGAIRSDLDGLGLGDIQVQAFGAEDEVLIRLGTVDVADVQGLEGVTEETGAEEAQQIARQTIQETLRAEYPGVEFRRVEVVGPQVSGELVVAGATAVLVALFLMLVYIWFRFEWQYSVGAVLALAHDVIATIGMFAVTQLEFNLSTIAAILTIVGYSMNDTVVIYDRIREKFRKFKTAPTVEVLNRAINKTLSRTILTSGTTLVALIAMALIGGPALQGFAFALIWGVVIGTYSSVFVAAPLLTLTGVKRETSQEGEVVAP